MVLVNNVHSCKMTLREKSPHLEFFWSVFSCVCVEYEEILRISPYSAQMPRYGPEKLRIRTHFTHCELCEFLNNHMRRFFIHLVIEGGVGLDYNL